MIRDDVMFTVTPPGASPANDQEDLSVFGSEVRSFSKTFKERLLKLC